MIARVLVLCALLSSAAHADNRADVLFKKGKKLLAQKKYAEACEAFEKSNKIEPGIGALLNVAHCFEEWGKLATAFKSYSDAEAIARDTKDNRLAKIHERVTKLDSLVPRLTVRAPSGADTAGLEVSVDGQKLASDQLGVAQLVDPGPHSIDYHAGDTKKSKVVPVERGGSSDITLELPKAVAKTPDKPKSKPDDDDDAAKSSKVPPKTDVAVQTDLNPGHGRRVTGVVLGTAGIIAMGVAGYLAVTARSSYNSALSDHCGGDKTMCDADGLTLTHDARAKANLATIVAGAGGAVTLIGLIVYVTAPSTPPTGEHALRVTPSAGQGTVGLVLDGRF